MQLPNPNQYPGFSMKGPFIGQYLSEGRNLLFNGDMFIDQANEGASVSLVSGNKSYICDGAYVLLTQASAVVTAQQVSDGPDGFIKSLKITTTTGNAIGVGDSLVVKMPIEGPVARFLGQGVANAGYMSLGFWVKTSQASQTFSMSLQNSAGARTYIASFTTNSANNWMFIPFAAIVGDITGTWLTAVNTVGLMLTIAVACGSTNQSSTLNAWQASGAFAANTQTNTVLTTNGATFQITGVQLEQGPNVTPFALLPYDTALQKCRRFYRKSFAVGTAPAQSAGVANAVTIKNPIALGDPAEWIPFEPPMAGSPTITTYNPSAANANWRDITAAADVTVSVDPGSTKGPGGVLLATSGTVTTLGDILAIHYQADVRL